MGKLRAKIRGGPSSTISPHGNELKIRLRKKLYTLTGEKEYCNFQHLQNVKVKSCSLIHKIFT